MPIKPQNRSLYPTYWDQIRAFIRARAGNCCEGSPRYPDCRAVNYQPHPVTGSIVVLTIAHLNHDPTDNRESNLACLCQRCHLTHDARHHAQEARRTRDRRRGQMRLLDE